MVTHVSAKAKLLIGTTVAATDATSFAADTYVEVYPVTSGGKLGPKSEELIRKYIGSGDVKRLKSFRDNGSMEITVDHDSADPGQIAVRAAEKIDSEYNFKIQFNNAPAGGTPSVRYFRALVMGAEISIGTATDAVEETYTLGISGAIVDVPAAPPAGP